MDTDEKEAKKLRAQIEETLKNLRTMKRIKASFPEALPFIEDAPVAAKPVTDTALLQLRKKVQPHAKEKS